ncbi:MAG: DUF3108 domain-containing protein [Pseudomonadota bacterium]
MSFLRLLASIALAAPLSVACASQPADAPASLAPAATAATAATAPAALAAKTADTSKASFPLTASSHRYHFSWDGNLSGNATRSLSCQQQVCSLHTEASVPGIGSLDERSQFSWREGKVQFESYQRQLQLLFFPQTVRIQRAGDGEVVTTDRKGKQRRYPDQPDLIDSLSLEARLRSDLMLTGKAQTQYLMADTKGVTALTLSELPAETLTVAEQKIAVRVFQRRNTEGTRITTLWLDPKQQFLPVQITHQDGAETYRMLWLGNAALAP